MYNFIDRLVLGFPSNEPLGIANKPLKKLHSLEVKAKYDVSDFSSIIEAVNCNQKIRIYFVEKSFLFPNGLVCDVLISTY